MHHKFRVPNLLPRDRLSSVCPEQISIISPDHHQGLRSQWPPMDELRHNHLFRKKPPKKPNINHYFGKYSYKKKTH